MHLEGVDFFRKHLVLFLPLASTLNFPLPDQIREIKFVREGERETITLRISEAKTPKDIQNTQKLVL